MFWSWLTGIGVVGHRFVVFSREQEHAKIPYLLSDVLHYMQGDVPVAICLYQRQEIVS